MTESKMTIDQAIARLGPNGLNYNAKRSLSPEIREACRVEIERRKEAGRVD